MTEDNCGICFRQLCYELETTLEDCNHKFCYFCIDQWTNQSCLCPYCHRRIKALQIKNKRVPFIICDPAKDLRDRDSNS